MPQNPLIELFFYNYSIFIYQLYVRALVYKRRHCVANDSNAETQCDSPTTA